VRRAACWLALAGALAATACANSPAPSRASASYADLLIGRVANAREDHAAAIDRYFAALARDPHDQSLINGALAAALAAGDLARARQAARLAPRQDAPGYAHLVRAADALAAQRWQAAEDAAGRVEGAAAEELIGRMMAVWVRTAQGRVDEVVMDLGPLASIRPYGGLFAYQQGMALDYAGRREAALAAYVAAAQGGLWLPQGVERHADLLVRMGEREQAIELLSGEANRQNPALSAALARVEAGANAASAPLTPARGAAAGLYGLAAIFLQETDGPNGFSALTLSLMLDPDADDARIVFAQALADRDHAELARSRLAEIAPTSPYAQTARRLESWILMDSGREEEALALAQANAASGDARSLRTLADMYRNLGRHGDGEQIYSALIAQSSDDWRLYFARGAARERLGRWPEAESDLQRALELSPEQPDVMNYLGYSWIDRGERLQEGLALIERAVALKPDSGAIIDSLGWAHYRLGDYALALELIERAVELQPGDATLNDHLGDVYWRLGRRIEARFQWRHALTLSPEDPEAIEAKLANGLPAEAPHRSAAR